MFDIEILKFGSSVLQSRADLPVALDEIYRRWRAGSAILVVVSAFDGVTNQLLRETSSVSELECDEATAVYVSTGEQKTAALLQATLYRHGVPSRIVEPREIGLVAQGAILNSEPVGVDVASVMAFWHEYPILILPGFYGIDRNGKIALFGRGGSDLSALFLAAELKGKCRLIKDVAGVFDADPVQQPMARRFSSVSWDTAVRVVGPLIQPKALSFARSRELDIEIGRANGDTATVIGRTADFWGLPIKFANPMRVAIAGCGTVGRGVYEAVKRYPEAFSVVHVIVRDVEKHRDVDRVASDLSLALSEEVDVVVVCFGGEDIAYELIAAALEAGKWVVTANKAVIAARSQAFARYLGGQGRRLWYSAAVGGAIPVLETLAACRAPVREIRGIVNGTCGFVLDAWGQGIARSTAVTMAQAAGFAEADPWRDLSGRDSADKLAILIKAAFDQQLATDEIPTLGIDHIVGDPAGYKLVARARRTEAGVVCSVQPERPSPGTFLAQARGAENRLEIELTTGRVHRLRGQGAGRWPTTVSVLGDLHEIARLKTKQQGINAKFLESSR